MWKSFLLPELIKVVLKARLFWPTWIAITVVAGVGVARSVGRGAAPMARGAGETSPIRKPRWAWSGGAATALVLLGLFLAGYIVLTLTWEDFAYVDNSTFTLGMLKGHDLGPPIWREGGRFFPLGHQEFDLIHHLTSTVAGYHALPIIQLLALCGILLTLDEELGVSARAGLTALVLVSPAIVTSFGGLIYTERNVVFWLACLALTIKCFEQTQASAWAVRAVVCAQFMIYYKETAFLLLLGWAVGRLVLRCKNSGHAGWNCQRLRDRESRLDLYLAFLGGLFLLNYWAAMLPRPHLRFAHTYGLSAAGAVLAYLKLDLLAWVFVAVALARVYQLLRHGAPPSPLWDGLAFGGVACFAAYLYLGLFSAYYLAPVDLIAVLYVGRSAILSWPQRSWGSKAPLLVLLGAVVFQNVALSAFRVYERKNVIHGKAAIAGVVKAQYQKRAGNVRRLFFPFASPYSVMEFASYLSFRGVPVEGVLAESSRLSGVLMAGRAVAKDGPCVDYRSVICHAAARPELRDLVIILPDDDASLAEVAPYQDRGELLFSYQPHPRIPQLVYPFVRHLRIASYAFARRELPDRWLHATVTLR